MYDNVVPGYDIKQWARGMPDVDRGECDAWL